MDSNRKVRKRALLLGNGINLLDRSQSLTWEELLADLTKSLSQAVDLKNTFKPFPLAFDELLHREDKISDLSFTVRSLKENIRFCIERQLLNKKGYNDFHRKICLLGYSDILTTNYDYSIQKSLEKDFMSVKDKLAANKQERKFSLKRHYKIPANNLNIWHIHGELISSIKLSLGSKYFSEESIMIGYEHYASYLAKIQENVKGKSGKQPIESQSLKSRLKDGNVGHFWTDIFFTHDLDIVGQGFDFSENHLWWLINHRANLIRYKGVKNEVDISNKLRYFYPVIDKPKESFEEKCKSMKSKAIADLLASFQVTSVPVECRGYKEFYARLTLEKLLQV